MNLFLFPQISISGSKNTVKNMMKEDQTMNDEIKLHQALYEMNRIAEQLFVSYGLLSKIIEDVPEDDPSDPMSTKKMLQHLTNELADYSTDLTDNAKSIKER